MVQSCSFKINKFCHLKFEKLFIFTISTVTKNIWSAAYTCFYHI
jgi:hypothetical protein